MFGMVFISLLSTMDCMYSFQDWTFGGVCSLLSFGLLYRATCKDAPPQLRIQMLSRLFGVESPHRRKDSTVIIFSLWPSTQTLRHPSSTFRGFCNTVIGHPQGFNLSMPNSSLLRVFEFTAECSSIYSPLSLYNVFFHMDGDSYGYLRDFDWSVRVSTNML